ncbi:MAG TPA: hypothetical protein VHN99_03120, partial [Deinococcales bacterium]|nr:hypothetical protein [Deinococcales bacterium]
DVGGRAHLRELSNSLVGTYDYATGLLKAYREEEFPALEALLRAASFVIGFNTEGFDLPILAAHLGDWVLGLKSLDLMLQACPPPRRRLPLSAFAEGSLNAAKSADGLQAVQFYREGRWEELERYCLDDVKITRDLYEYGLEHGALRFKLGKRNGLAPVAYPNQAPFRRDRPKTDGPALAAVAPGAAVTPDEGQQTPLFLLGSDLANHSVRFSYRGREKTLQVSATRGGLLIGTDEAGQERAFPIANLQILEVV